MDRHTFTIIHPLDDEPEQKHDLGDEYSMFKYKIKWSVFVGCLFVVLVGTISMVIR